MALTKKHVTNVCNMNNPYDLCKYFNIINDKDKIIFICGKFYHKGGLKINDKNLINCSGYLPLLEIEQGYDLD